MKDNRPLPRSILMTTMSLDIGGAETHIIELAKELKRRGIAVTVASHGGAYVSELCAAGISHVTLPLHSKHPISVLRSYFGLRRLIRREHFDIVHAHARIPAFVCGLLARRLHFRFVTSAHWVFHVNALWRAITDWGERTVAVSRDIKQYLIDNYGVYADNISVTINGIDTDRFSPDADRAAACRALGLSVDCRRILCVSRMDEDRSLAPIQLAEAAGSLGLRYPHLEVVIAGDGNDFARLRAAADRSNAKVGREVVRLVGATTSVAQYIAASDLFVGVSRAALEAMSAGKPTVVAGNEGYLGIYTRDKEEEAYRTNFCCRGCAASTVQQLAQDLEVLLTMETSALAQLSHDARELIERVYSVHRMGDDYLACYRACAPYAPYRHGDVVISGYYGYGNAGDDSLLTAILDTLHDAAPDLSVTVLTSHTAQMRKRFGVRCIGRYRYFAVVRELRHAKLFLSGGGSLLQDVTSSRSLLYYTMMIGLAKRLGCRVCIYASGIGPLQSDKSRRRAARALQGVERITLRDSQSLETLQKMGISQAHVTADPAYLLSSTEAGWTTYLRDRLGLKPQSYFLVSARPWQETSPDFAAQLGQSCNAIAQHLGLRPVFVVMQGRYDAPLCRALADQCAAFNALCVEGLSAGELIALCADAVFVTSMRLHLLIYAADAGTPMIGLSYDPKVDAMTDVFAMPQDSRPPRIPVCGFSAESMAEAVSALLQNREARAAFIAQTRAQLGDTARRDAEEIAALLGSTASPASQLP